MLSIRSDVVEFEQTSAEKKSKKAENLVSSGFYGFVSLIVQLQHSKQLVTTVVIPHLQHI
jgi:hypothetical protein